MVVSNQERPHDIESISFYLFAAADKYLWPASLSLQGKTKVAGIFSLDSDKTRGHLSGPFFSDNLLFSCALFMIISRIRCFGNGPRCIE